MVSNVWKAFKKTSTKQVQCNFCKMKLNFSGPTSQMIRHLRQAHPALKQAYDDEVFQNLWDSDHLEEIGLRATKLLARSFAVSNIPFRFASNPLFRDFCKTVSPNYEVPSAKGVRREILQSSKEYVAFVKHKLRNTTNFVVVTDGFSDLSSNKSFYSVHLVYVDESFERHTRFVGIEAVKKGSSENVSKAVTSILKSVGLSLMECHATVTDGGSNLRAFSASNLLPNSHCGCHIIHLIFSDFEKTSKPINILLTHARKVTGELSRRRELREEVRQKTTDPDPLPKPQCVTRWAHQFLLLRAYKIHYRAISAVMGMQLRTHQISLLENVVSLMEPLFISLKKFESDSSFATDIVPTLIAAKTKMGRDTKTARDLSTIVEKRIQEFLENNDFIRMATILDPRNAFLPRLFPEPWDYCEKLINDIDPGTPTATSDTSSAEDSESDLMNSFYDERSDNTVSTGLECEILKFRALLVSNRPSPLSDPLQFWKSQRENMPKLAALARSYLSAPASSATAERLFSRCTDVMRQKKRNRLNVETLNAMLLTNCIIERDDGDSDDDYGDGVDDHGTDGDVDGYEGSGLDEDDDGIHGDPTSGSSEHYLEYEEQNDNNEWEL